MEYKIKKIENGNIWNDFVKQNELVNILSSWEWRGFEKQESYGIYKENDLCGVFSFKFVNAKKGKFLLLRHSVFFDWKNKIIFEKLIGFLKKRCKELGASFFRISPTLLYSDELNDVFFNYGFKKSVLQHTDAQLTTVLDLTQSLDDILINMRKNTRYSIRKGEKMNIEIQNLDSLPFEFKDMYEKTVKRNNWNAFDYSYVKEQFEFFSSKGLSRVFVSKLNNEVISIAIFTVFNNQVIYHHSASFSSKVPANYVLIWEAIKYYKGLGIRDFNFFGVSEKNSSGKKDWDGFSLFKRGFGDNERVLMENFDYPISLFYFFTRFLEL